LHTPNLLHARSHLRRRTPFLQAVAETLALGGDVDTNAAIVGGMAGALHGAASIPGSMSAPVLGRGPRAPGRPRPAFLSGAAVRSTFEELWAAATAEVVGGGISDVCDEEF